MRPPVDHIAAPPFPPRLPWINVAALRMDQQLGRPVLIEFWDFCRPNSIRTLPYMRAWHERYEPAGLRVIGVHAAGFEPSADPDAVRAAVQRLDDSLSGGGRRRTRDLARLRQPRLARRYLFGPNGRLFDYHYGEGGYDETERAIQELLEIERAAARAAASRGRARGAADAADRRRRGPVLGSV